MKSNQDLARLLDEIAQCLELQGAGRFRVNAYARAARAIRDQSASVIDLADDRAALTAIDGVGDKMADKIIQYAEEGRIDEHDEALASTPRGLLDVLAIPGLGPKTVKAMWEQCGVEDLAGLKRIIDDGTILSLPRMGEKAVENIKAALEFAASAGERIRIGLAMPIAETIVERMQATPGAKRVQYAGSLRRGAETIGDVDILMSTDDPDAARDAFTTMPEVEQVLASGETKSSVRARFDRTLIQADLRIVPDGVFGAALMYFTGSKEHNVRLRERALKHKLTLNEYGLFPLDDEDEPPQKRGVKPVAAAEEADVYKALDVPFIPPELREDRGELGADAATIDAVITLEDVRAELHAHTTASDGKLSIRELADAARDRGFHTLAVTDHSRSSVLAGGLDDDALREHIAAVRDVAATLDDFTLLAGSEVDILPDGALDYDDDLLAELDVVVASPHVSLRQTPKDAMRRLIRAIENPFVHILGHPSGRLISKREGLPIDINELAAAAAEHGVALEINANWMRLDLRDAHVAAAVDAGALIAIDCDVHRATDYDNLRFGVLTARRGRLPREQCVNTWDAARLRDWLASRRP